ncbi:MAG: twin-arginine translocation signal domain-containing protein, partial [Gammaproteobacteria bacterium]|nr:twin-arginine translocation signal domain-containing protein [Gammaproteobacteria bacterium]
MPDHLGWFCRFRIVSLESGAPSRRRRVPEASSRTSDPEPAMADKPDSHHPAGKPFPLNRRDFLKAGALGVAAGAAAGCTEPGAEAATTGAQARASATAATPQ